MIWAGLVSVAKLLTVPVHRIAFNGVLAISVEIHRCVLIAADLGWESIATSLVLMVRSFLKIQVIVFATLDITVTAVL